MSYLQSNQAKPMTVFYTSNHDMSLVSSQTEFMPSDIELRELAAEVDDIHAELTGDDYADAILADIN